MNERIQQLLDESKLTSVQEMFEPELYKFAELIVKECAEIYECIDNGNLHAGTDDYLEALHKTFRN